MLQTYPKGLKESLAKRLEEQKKEIEDLRKSSNEKKILITEMREFGAKHGLKGKEMAEAFKKYKAGISEPKKEYKEEKIMSEYFEIPKNLEEEEIDFIKGKRNTYNTFKKRGAEKNFLDRWNTDDMFNEFKKYIIPKSDQKSSKIKKEYKEEKIMKASSELKKKGSKYTVDTEMNVKEGLDGKTVRALIESIINELNNNFDDYEFFYEKKN